MKIGKKYIGDNHPCFISLEPGATHTGLKSAKALARAVANSGADGIKFQTFITGDADRLMKVRDIEVSYHTPRGKRKETVYQALKRREMSKSEWSELCNYCKSKGLSFISSAHFPESIDFLHKIGVDAFKVSKGDINNPYLVECMAKKGIPVILDGRENFEAVNRAVEICENLGNRQIVIMHCPSGYPAKFDTVHLNAIRVIKEIYPDYPVGYADHCIGMLINFPALALGAKMLEVTVTLDKSTNAVEHYMSLEPPDLKEFVAKVRAVESSLGDGRVIFSSRVRDSARRSLVTKTVLNPGQKL